MKLPKRTQKLVNEFDDAAQSHGWESDQGSEYAAYKAKQKYIKCKKRLEDHIARIIKKVEQ